MTNYTAHMFSRGPKSQNALVSELMRDFFSDACGRVASDADPSGIAKEYGRFLWRRNRVDRLLEDKQNARSRFYPWPFDSW